MTKAPHPGDINGSRGLRGGAQLGTHRFHLKVAETRDQGGTRPLFVIFVRKGSHSDEGPDIVAMPAERMPVYAGGLHGDRVACLDERAAEDIAFSESHTVDVADDDPVRGGESYLRVGDAVVTAVGLDDRRGAA